MATTILPTRTDGTEAYSFQIRLDGALFRFDFSWNYRGEFWSFRIYDAAGTRLAARVVVLGWPLLSRYRDERLPAGDLIAIDTSGASQEPGLKDLGARVQLLYLGVDDLVAALSA